MFAKASLLRNFTQSFTALPMLSKAICEKVSTVLTMTSPCLDIFPRSLEEKESPESLYRKIAGFYFVICRPDRFDVSETPSH